MAKDSLKKSKRKGRNKQEVMMVSEQQPEPEEVKTPIDLMKVRCRGRRTFWKMLLATSEGS